MNKLILSSLLLLPSAAIADPAEEVRCAEIGFSRSAEEGDRARFESFIDPDARFIGATVNRGVAEISKSWDVFFEPHGPGIKWRPRIVEVLEDGNLALTRGPYRVISRDEEGNAKEHWGTFNSVWRRQANGQWKVVFDAGNDGAENPSDDVKALLDRPVNCGKIMNPEKLEEFAVHYAEAWSSGDPASFASFYAEHGSLRINDGEPAVGREAVEHMAADFMTAFPDMVVHLVELRQEGDVVEFRWHWTGTNTGPGGTGNAVDLTGFEEWTFDSDGLILTSLGHMDKAEYERQLHAGEPGEVTSH